MLGVYTQNFMYTIPKSHDLAVSTGNLHSLNTSLLMNFATHLFHRSMFMVLQISGQVCILKRSKDSSYNSKIVQV